MEKLTATKTEEGYSISGTAKDADGNAKDCSTYTTYKLQMWLPGLNPDDSDNLTVNASISWTVAASGTWYYTIADGDFDTAGTYHARIALTKSGVVEFLSVFAIVIPDPTLYCTIEEVKSELEITTDDYDDWLHAMCQAVKDLFDEYCHTNFTATTATRYFDGANTTLFFDDLIEVTTLKLDEDCDGSFEATLTEDTDFYLLPYNDTPKRMAVISDRSDRSYHDFNPGVKRGVQIIGSWGYQTTVPKLVRRAAIFQIADWKAWQESGYTGVIGSPDFGGSRTVGKTLSQRVTMILDKFKRRDFF